MPIALPRKRTMSKRSWKTFGIHWLPVRLVMLMALQARTLLSQNRPHLRMFVSSSDNFEMELMKWTPILPIPTRLRLLA
jgi:hypothetical protein